MSQRDKMVCDYWFWRVQQLLPNKFPPLSKSAKVVNINTVLPVSLIPSAPEKLNTNKRIKINKILPLFVNIKTPIFDL